MKRYLLTIAAGLILAGAAHAQSTTGQTTTTTPTLASQAPAQNVRAGSVSARAPGLVIDAARARHTELRNARLALQQSGGERAETENSSGSDSSNSSSIESLLSSFGLGSLGSMDIGTISSLLGSTGGTTGTTTSTGSTTNSNIPSNLTPEVLAALSAAGININELYPPDEGDTSGSKTMSSTGNSKDSDRSQTTGEDDEPKFVTRWTNSMLSTFFTAIVIGMQTPDFIELLANNLRPILRPETNEE